MTNVPYSINNDLFYINSGSRQYSLTSESDGITNQKYQELSQEINQKLSDKQAESYSAETYYDALDIPQDKETVCVYNRYMTIFELKRWADYVVVKGSGYSTSQALLNNSTLGTSDDYIKILASSDMQFVYIAGEESGEIVNTGKNVLGGADDIGGSISFGASNTSGNWSIYSESSNDWISTSNGNNTIHAGLGNNTIALGTGNNIVYSEGKDTISGSGAGYQSVTLTGSQSQVNLKTDQAYVTDIGNSNTISIGNNSTVAGGNNGKVTFNAGNQNVFYGGSNNAVTTTKDSTLQVVHGSNNTFAINNDLFLFNSMNTTTVTINGSIAAFGAANSNYIINSLGDVGGFFVADTGNETLNASGSTAALSIYANTVSGAQTNFVASGGTGDDVFVAGTGNSTFTGGAGNNAFLFDKDTNTNGHTIITDFAKSQNTISLYNYNFTQDSLTQLLQQSINDTQGNAVLNLEGHSITLQGVSVSDLNINQFSYGNTNQNG